MATKVTARTTFEAARVIEPIYTGGEVSSDVSGSFLATTVEEDIFIVDVRSGKSILQIDGDGESVTCLSLSPTATHLVVCSRSLSMRIYALLLEGDSCSAELVRTLKPHSTPVISLAIDSTGSILATGGADGVVKVWDIHGGYCSHTFHGHGGLVTAVEFFTSSQTTSQKQILNSRKRKISSDSLSKADDGVGGQTILLASGGEDGKIKIWNLTTRNIMATLDSHVSVVRSLKFSYEHSILLSASRDRTIVIWDSESWSPRRIIPCLESLEAAGFVHKSIFCYSGGERGRLRLWNTETGQEVSDDQDQGLETESIVSIVDVKGEEALLTVHQDQTLILHSCKGLQNLPAGKRIPALPIIRRISGNHDEIIDMALLGQQQNRLALATNTEAVKIVSISESADKRSTEYFASDIAVLEGHQDIIICMDVDWSGHWLATGAKDNTARLWRLDTVSDEYQCFAIFQGHAESLGAISLPSACPQGSSASKDPHNHPPAFLITGSQDKTIKKWDTSKLKLLKPGEEPHNVAKAVYTRVAHEKDINAIDVSPIAPLFASASQDKIIKIWSVEDGSTTAVLRGHKRGVWSVKFSPEGTPAINLAEGGSSSNQGLLVSGSGDRSVKIWSLATYTCLLTLEGHSNSVLKVIWLPPLKPNQDSGDGKQQRHDHNRPMIASASSDTLVKIWTPYASPDSDHLLATLDNHTDRVWSLASHKPSDYSRNASTNTSDVQSHQPFFTFISGAADARLTFWKDTTTATANAASRHLTERIEQDQLLQNHIHSRNYRESISLALTLNHPGRLLKIFEDITNLPETQKEKGSIIGVKAVDEVLASLSQAELYRLLERVRDWNTNARTATVAQCVLHVLFKSYPADTWVDMTKNQRALAATLHELDDPSSQTAGRKTKMMSMADLFRALEVYTERHYKRTEELIDESYLIEYTLREMDELTGGQGLDLIGTTTEGVTNGKDQDMAMV